jgi:hypothetical protein
MPIPRTNINAAAARVAAHYGLTIRFRETLEPNSGRLSVVWMLDSAEKSSSHELRLECTPPPFAGKGEGWNGYVTLQAFDSDKQLRARCLVDPMEGMASKMSAKLARERFCEWAQTLEPSTGRIVRA